MPHTIYCQLLHPFPSHHSPSILMSPTGWRASLFLGQWFPSSSPTWRSFKSTNHFGDTHALCLGSVQRGGLQGAAVTTGSPTRPPMLPGVKVESGEKEGEKRK